MALTPRLDLRQSQSLVMTPQLQMAVRLLALSNLELEAVVAEEVAKNPLLQGDEGREIAMAPRDDSAQGTDRMLRDGVEASGNLDVDLSAETFHHDTGADANWSDVAGSGGGSGEAPDMDLFGAAGATLIEHLTGQAGESLSGTQHMLAIHIIEALDDAGYLTEDLGEMAMRLGVSRAEMEHALAGVQRFDPTGVGARDLAECIALQAREADRYDPMIARLIDNLDLLARGQINQLRRICDADAEDMADMIRELRGYDPKPGHVFARNDAPPIVPDLFVRESADGWTIEINGATLPRLLVNRRYHAELSRNIRAGGKRDAAAKSWLSDALANANWLMRALDQRQQTILRVGEEIVRLQGGFFTHGVAALIPLTLRQVAETIGVHESTVSRATSNKYLHCARGTFELKYFFSSGIAAADSADGMSAEAVKARIKALIDAEAADAILSDDTLVELLQKQGCDIARRTVAKYREAMGIGSSVQRRRARAISG